MSSASTKKRGWSNSDGSKRTFKRSKKGGRDSQGRRPGRGRNKGRGGRKSKKPMTPEDRVNKNFEAYYVAQPSLLG